ncbi:maleate cis-trans isomerase [Saccharopolyspora erythraea]|uniref:maleate cis-trans isomerase family protein n=1 Tax=Saccharopolyspora erythraea TaxID=1836 RepID=UPI001BAB31BD|nr:maleate cis-trans isomerase [Saccharopolyspora erythraea]QUH01343.1 maleate cis-trans isomerase [Saccharopolyspora erythraea]
MWQPDGWDARARIGVLTPHGDVGPESELQVMAPDGVRVHAARVPFGAMARGGRMPSTIPLGPIREYADPPHVDDAARLLAAAPVRSIAFAFTSSGYATGPAAEAEMLHRLNAATQGIPVVATCSAAVLALRALGVGELALLDPPWFDQRLSGMGAEYFRDQGLEVVFNSPVGLPSNQRSINPGELYDWVREHVPARAEAVFVGGNGMRAVGVIAALEQDLGRPVLTANQVLLWHALHAGGLHVPVHGYGCLFDVQPPPHEE